jgi:hypothetical protein
LTDTPTHTETAAWSGKSDQSQSSGITHNISWEAWASITKKPNAETGGFLFSGNLFYRGSIILRSLFTSTTQLGESTGIEIVKPETFPKPDFYQYLIWPCIFDSDPAPGIVQVINLSTDTQTSGILRAAFAAAPSSNAGAQHYVPSAPRPQAPTISEGMPQPLLPNQEYQFKSNAVFSCVFWCHE